MEKAILSRINLKTLDTNIAYDYFETISDLIDTKEVQDLKKCSQHLATSRFQHSLNVSYYSFLICRKFGLDAYSAARAGLLHDLYYYDWKTNDKRPLEGNHAQWNLEPAEPCDMWMMLAPSLLPGTMGAAFLSFPVKTASAN